MDVSVNHRVPALDGVRAIAVLTVLAVHMQPKIFYGGVIGVDLFFVLSGFLITSILLSEYRETGSISIGRFYLRRALRLFPALALMVFVTVVYSYFFEPAERFDRLLETVKWVAGYSLNWAVVWNLPNVHYFRSDLLLHCWSLAVEEQFYIVWPVLLSALLLLKTPNVWIRRLIISMIVLPLLARLAIWYVPGCGADRLWKIYLRTDLRLDALAWGLILAWLNHEGFVPSERIRKLLPWNAVAALVLFFSYCDRERL